MFSKILAAIKPSVGYSVYEGIKANAMNAEIEKVGKDVAAYLFFGLLLVIILNSCAPRVMVVNAPPPPRKVVVVAPRPRVMMPAPPPPPMRFYRPNRRNGWHH